MRAYRVVWLSFCGIVGVTGAMVAFTWPLSMITLLFTAAAVTGGVFAMVALDPEDTDRLPRDRWRIVVTTAVLTAAGSIAFAGVGTVLGPAMALLVLVLTIGGSPYVARRWLGWLRDHDHLPARVPRTDQRNFDDHWILPDPEPSSSHEPDSAAKPSVVPAELSDDALCLAWRASFSALQRATSPTQRMRIVEERRAYLEELERRHRHGMAAWLASGARAAGDPTRFVLGDAATGRTSIDWDALIHGTDK